jgi:hypothetical protein
MNWNEFFKLTKQKTKVTVIIIIFYYFMMFVTNFINNILTPTFYQAINAATQGIEISTSSLFSALSAHFLILIIVSYLVACINESIFKKRGKK